MIGNGEFKEGDVGFKFGMYASAETEKISGVSISQIFRNLNDGKSLTEGLLHYFYGAAVAYNKKHKLPNIDIIELSEKLEAIGFDRMMEIYTESLKSPESKNHQPPQETGASSV